MSKRHLSVRILSPQPHGPVVLPRRETLRKSPDIPCFRLYRLGSLAATNSYFGAEKREIRPSVSVRGFAISVFSARGGPETHLFYTETRFDLGARRLRSQLISWPDDLASAHPLNPLNPRRTRIECIRGLVADLVLHDESRICGAVRGGRNDDRIR